ncbi:carcinoembryonic antigen-related cell adhesion molecule 20-like [Mobula hypostoma]|uniref:carcinoembryonic antigen-related cell adhesion molecule 20-like n=1 Tax=Mobula hypostoma TaxID=723540 RepID=UPI002FC31AA0
MAPQQMLLWLVLLIVPWPFPGVMGMPVEVTVGENPVQTGVGWNTTLPISTTSQLFIVEWQEPTGGTILTQINGQLFIKAGTRYTDRVSLLPNGSLTISSTTLADEGNYSVKVEPNSGQGVTTNILTINLLVYEPVTGVTLTRPRSGILEGTANFSHSCSVLTGTRISFSWLKDERPLVNSSRVRVAGSEMSIRQVVRTDTGQYTCVVRNPVSSGSQRRSLTVYYGPESLVVSRQFQSDCVTPDQVILGRSGSLICQADSVPQANFSWTRQGQALAQGSTLLINSLTSNDTGLYICTAFNIQTGFERAVSTNVVGVGGCLSVGGVVGVVIGAVVALVLLVLLIVFLLKRKKNRNAPSKKQAVAARSREVDAKVLPWIQKHQQETPGFASPSPLERGGPDGNYSSYPPSTGSMVPSTLNGASVPHSAALTSGRQSTLV